MTQSFETPLEKAKQSKQNETKSKLRISIIFIFRHCFMLSFSPLSHTFNNLKSCYACRFLCKIFFTYHRLQDFFWQVSLAGISFWELSPHLWLFLMVCPLSNVFLVISRVSTNVVKKYPDIFRETRHSLIRSVDNRFVSQWNTVW